jgi:Peptidase family M3
VALTPERLRADANAFMEEVSREFLLVHSGLKGTAELQPIYERYARVLGPAAMDLVRAEFRDAAPGSEAYRGARLMLEWEVESQTGRALAELEEREIAWESSAVVALADGRQFPYHQAAIEIANTTDRRDRLAIDEARAALVESGLVPIRRDRLQRERDFVESLEIAPSYNAAFTVMSGIPLDDLVDQCRQCLRDTEAVWGDLLPRAAQRSLGVPVSDLTRADALALVRAPEFDRYFPGAAMEDAVRRQVTEMGVDPGAGGRVRYDTGERAGKRSRAFCAPVQVPDEVYLVMRPHGGQTDYQTLLHELGHALHFAYTRADLPFEYRWVGDNSVTESYAMLFDHLMQNPGWLLRYSGLGKRELPPFLRAAALEELQFLRRYCAKLIYEVQLYGGQLSWDLMPDLYVETLSEATSFRYRRADAFIDVDSRYYAARYLRAWQLGALLAEALTERFNDDWYRNPRAGPWIVEELFAEGQRELADEIAQRVAGRSLSFGPVIKAVERLII